MSGARGLQVAIAVSVSVTLVGLFTGLRENASEAATYLAGQSAASSAGPAPKARSYADERRGGFGPNARLNDGAFKRLADDRPGVFDEVKQRDEDRQQALDRRHARRAYDGAPPTIPHKIGQLAVPDCLGCHETGARVAGHTAPRMSHPRYDNCTQCHVVGDDPRTGADTPPPLAENTFVGAPSPTRGERAWPGAPPTIPHGTLTRTDCGSCHGVLGSAGLRSPHPSRQSCTQCHTPSATIDQRPDDLPPLGL